ncbi:LPXTG cell wall anchor domain-containing protein [uncultured Microbacterium sp.]|uniref:LPXTG cell wall anchor domain-containing protein n=1 Tax=uncultured Microbacterium sp. TaxID=191216 RepID=UPI0035CBC669
MAVPSVAHAADDGYPPQPPTTPTLAGSTAMAACEADTPWIEYSVTLTDPANVTTGDTAVLFMTDGANSTQIPLGELQADHLEGRVLWPGATVGADGRGNGWPGWSFENGQWVQTSGNFAWTRGAITAEIRVNPQLTVPLAYPPSTAACLTDPAGAIPATTGSLPATGMSAMVLPLGIAGGGIVLAGIVLLLARRRARA